MYSNTSNNSSNNLKEDKSAALSSALRPQGKVPYEISQQFGYPCIIYLCIFSLLEYLISSIIYTLTLLVFILITHCSLLFNIYFVLERNELNLIKKPFVDIMKTTCIKFVPRLNETDYIVFVE